MKLKSYKTIKVKSIEGKQLIEILPQNCNHYLDGLLKLLEEKEQLILFLGEIQEYK